MHTFLKIRRPVDIPGPLESDFPIIPILYAIYVLHCASIISSALFLLADIEIPQGPHQVALLRIYQVILQVCNVTKLGGDYSSASKTAYLRDLTHAFALCDRHMRRIVGKWYRCAFCAKDLCADCEVLDTHDNTHLFLVFKAPVDMQAFRCAFITPAMSRDADGWCFFFLTRHFADLDNPAGSPPVLRGSVYYSRHE